MIEYQFKDVIEKSFNRLLKIIIEREKNGDRIYTNLCISGAACEDWFKFELTSQLINNFTTVPILIK